MALASIQRFFYLCLDLIFDFFFKIFNESGRQKVSAIKDPILLESATSLAEKIRNKQLSSLEVVNAYINRIKEVNGIINALVDSNFEQAREEAEKVDDLIEQTDDLDKLAKEKPFLGVPLTCKEAYANNGLKWSNGLLCRKNTIADFDCDATKLMKDAGAIMIGVTNVPELCMWIETNNNVYGRSRNPYHSGRTCGGSSGGEGALIGAGGSVIGIGSDIGGSIRLPASFCGIFGHKPSAEIVSNAGGHPLVVPGKDIDNYLTTGPICRYACDLMPFFKILCRKEKLDELQLDKPVDIRNLRIFYMDRLCDDPSLSPVDNELKDAQMRVLNVLKKEFDLDAKKFSFSDTSELAEMIMHKTFCEEGAPSFSEEMCDLKGEVNPTKELLKWLCFGMSDYTLPMIMLALAEKQNGYGVKHPDFKRLMAKLDKLAQEIDDFLGDDGVMICQSHPLQAPYHGKTIQRNANINYTVIFNVTRHPSTQVPLGMGNKGVPIGVQIVGKRITGDRNTLALALEMERLFGGWVPPGGVF